jgi:hypothetical protein
MSFSRREALLGALLILSAAPGWLPELRQTREAVSLARLPYEARRARVNGPFWISIAEVQRRMPAGEPVRVILRRPHDWDRLVFLTYYLYPHVTRWFASLDHYRAVAPAPPETLLAYIDVERLDAVRVMTYGEIRAEQMRETPFPLPPLSGVEGRELIVPFAASFDGIDSYVTEAVFVAASDGTLTLTLEPDGRAWVTPLRAGEPLVLQDVVYSAFQVMTSGWIRVTSTVPLRAGASLINRGRGRSTSIPIFSAVPPLPRSVPGGDKLWLLNAGAHEAGVVVNGARVTLPPWALQSMPSAPVNEIDGSGSVLPFTSRKLPDGNTEFAWP